MADIYVYSQDNTDLSTIGECGALDATSCLFEEIANGESELTLEHPIDALGKFRYIQTGALLKAEVPVRTVPEISNGSFVTSVETWSVKQTSTNPERRLYTTRDGDAVIKKIERGRKVTVIKKPLDSERWKVTDGKATGWIASVALESRTEVTIPDAPDGIDAAVPRWECRPQLFRIYKVTTTESGITASARHISYDLLYNLTTYDMPREVEFQDALDGMLSACLDAHEFSAQTNIKGTRAGLHYNDKNPIEAILDPDEGMAQLWDAQLVRDDYELYLLDKAGGNSGMSIEYGKNLTGVEIDEDMSNVATAIRPVGETEDGLPLYLDEDNGLVRSPLSGNYPFQRISVLRGENCTVNSKEGPSEANVKLRLKEQAQAEFDKGADLPTVSARVTFAQLGSGTRYRQYRDLESVYLWDEVTIRHPGIGVNLTTEVVRVIWDCVLERMESIELGSLQALTPSVAGWQLRGGISGGKIAQGSIGVGALADGCISSRHIQSESITTEALQAGSITAEKLAAGAITADSINTGLLEAVTAIIENLKAGHIDADELTARFAEFATVVAGTATFDRETVRHLVAEAMHLSFGEADSVFIQNLMVTYAQFAAATIGDLVVKASDGKYYHLDVNPTDGTVTATPADVTEGDITSGHTTTGETIIDTNILAENLSTANLFATYALINQIDAARIDVDQLFAREAFLDLLWTSQIHGDESIEFWAHNSVQSVKTEYCISDSPSMVTDEEGWSEEYPKEVLSNQYIWRRLKAYKGSGQYEITSLECITLQQGAVGPQGVGIESVEEFYGLSASSAAQPSEWTSEPKPPTPELRYLWNKETIHYTDKSSQEGQPHIIGVFGEDGKIGRGIEEIINYYLASSESSGVTRQTEGWSKEMQATSDEKRYLWNYEETVWSDGSEHTYTNPIIIGTQGVKGDPGPQGPAGEQGIEGPPGPEGKSSYFHIKYSAKENPTSSADMTEEASTYIGTYVDFTEEDSNDPFKYKWQRLEGAQGKDGKQGIPGDNGVDGKTSYLHIKYSNDGKTFTANEGEDPGDWIGQYVDFTLEDSTNFGDYKWSKIKGEQGQPGLQGLQGEKGEDGIPGEPGKDGSDGSSINLLLGTKDFSGSWTNRGSYSEGEAVGDFTVLTKTAAWGGVNQKVSVGPGSYTFSCWVKTGESVPVVYYTPNANDAESKKLNTWVENIPVTPNTWTHIVGHTFANEAATLNPRVEIKTATDVSLYGYKLEAGNVTNPVWSPNPADLATYFHIKYSAKENPTTAADMKETPDVYIGTYVDSTQADSTDPKKYTWYRFQGLQGEKGEQGIPGVGQDGKTYYLHIKYSNDGGKTFTGNSGEDSGAYIGVCTDTNEADPTDVSKYKWSKIKGEDGSQGINLLRRTAEYAYSAKGASVTLTQDGDFTVANLPMVASGGNEWGNSIVSLNIPFSNVRNQTATLSLDIKCDDVSKYTSGTNGLYFAAQLNYEGSGRQFTQNINPFKTITLSNDWTRVRQVIDCHDAKFSRESSNTSYNIGDDTLINIAVYNRSATTGLHIRKLKLELGDVASPVWTPNPSDVSYTPVPQYYLSTSPTTQAGGSWSETQPTWKANTYIWERLRCVWSDGRADTYTTPQRALALEQALKAAQDAKDVADAANLTAANAVDGLNNLNGEMGDLHDHLRSLDTRMTLVGNSDDADEAPSTLRPAGLYVGLDGWPVQAYIDATGWFRVWANGRSITAMGPNEIDLGDLVFYNNGQDVSVMKKG